MKVKQLIEELSIFNPDMEVRVQSWQIEPGEQHEGEIVSLKLKESVLLISDND